jgi:hypothetical protein
VAGKIFWIIVLIAQILFAVYYLLLGFRVLGKRPGTDEAFDKQMKFLSGSYKVVGVLLAISAVFYLVFLLGLRE